MVERRAAGEPLQYVLGRWAFRTLDLLVDRRVLIPRPETEVVAGFAIAAAAAVEHDAVVVDLGTGSGAIALAVAAERWPHVEVWGTDASAGALAVARANLAGLGRRASVARLVEGDWFAALPEDLRGRVDVIVSNPPYVGTAEPLAAEVADWEPLGALFAGADGLDDLRRIIAEAPGWLRPGGVLVLEIGETQGAAVLDLAAAAGLVDAVIEPDLTGRDRALVAHSPLATEPVEPAVVDPHVVERIVAALRAGEVVVLPTDTVYGLVALPSDPVAMDAVFALKGRGDQVPIAVLCADADQALALAGPAVDPAVRQAAERWWPGPLTLVLPRQAGLELHLGEPATTIGVRVPDHALVRAVAAQVGPVAATSANPHGAPPATTAAEARAGVGTSVALVVDGGPSPLTASTVIDATTHPWRVVREGPLPAASVLAVAGG
jgi:release factor glutamine methyltransferase